MSTLPTEGHDPGPVVMKVRDVHFDLSEAPLHWMPDHPIESHLVNAFHMLVPEAERFFLVAFREALPLVQDARIREDMLAFMGQETTHADAHERAIQEMLERHGIDPTPVLDQMAWILQKGVGPKVFHSEKRQRAYLNERLALIAAIENYTAFLGDFALKATWDKYGGDPNVVGLLRWHGAEEMEHRAVAHDVMTYFSRSYFLRVRAMAILVPAFGLATMRMLFFVMRRDPSIKFSRLAAARAVIRAGRIGLAPPLSQIIGAAITYLRPSYMPDDLGPMAPALDYLARLDAQAEA